jgi:hypothetical protein
MCRTFRKVRQQPTIPLSATTLQQFHEFQRRYPKANSQSLLNQGILPDYPTDMEAYRLARQWEEAHGYFESEAQLADIPKRDDEDLTPEEVQAALYLPLMFLAGGRWRQSPAYHLYADTPRDRMLLRSFRKALNTLLARLSERDIAILHLHADKLGPREIRRKLGL